MQSGAGVLPLAVPVHSSGQSSGVGGKALQQLLVLFPSWLAQVIEGVRAGGCSWKALQQLLPAAIGLLLLAQGSRGQRLLLEHHRGEWTLSPALSAQQPLPPGSADIALVGQHQPGDATPAWIGIKASRSPQ